MIRSKVKECRHCRRNLRQLLRELNSYKEDKGFRVLAGMRQVLEDLMGQVRGNLVMIQEGQIRILDQVQEMQVRIQVMLVLERESIFHQVMDLMEDLFQAI